MDKTAPAEYDLPLADGWTIVAGCQAKYFKTQDNVVTVICNIMSGNEASNGTVLATLPAGYRPAYRVKVPVLATSVGGVISTGYVDINNTGQLMLYRITTAVTELEMPTATFIAGN